MGIDAIIFSVDGRTETKHSLECVFEAVSDLAT